MAYNNMVKLKNISLTEKTKTKKTICCMIPINEISIKGKSRLQKVDYQLSKVGDGNRK